MTEVRVVVRPYASALPLGFFSFGIGMLLLGGFANGWLDASERHTVGLMLAAFVFPLELLAAGVAFLARDTFAATGLGLFSASWLMFGLADLTSAEGSLSRAVGLYEFGFAFAIGLLAIAAFAGKPLIAVILLVSAVRSVFAGVVQWGGPKELGTASGWIAVAVFALAMYGAIAFLLEDVQKEQVLPVFRRGASRESFEGDLAQQLHQLADEAGVRKTL